ncbi:Uncharacterised protein [Segatella copri]|nr:Uncharacterised protein [Segatella copri]
MMFCFSSFAIISCFVLNKQKVVPSFMMTLSLFVFLLFLWEYHV